MTQTYRDVLAADGVLYTTIVGVSMMPLLREGKDIIGIRPVQGGLNRYDAVLFQRPGVEGRGAYVCHRILKVLPEDRYRIVGDNCTEGEIVAGADILGRMTGIRRGGRDISLDSLGYRLYLTLWVRPVRLRVAVLRCRNFARRAVGCLLRRLRSC